MRKAAVFIAVAFLLALGAAPVYADDIPPLPHAFYGELLINGNPAPAETTVEARGANVRTGIEGNPITTTELGKYGSSNPLEQRLIVQGDITEGAIITFWVNDVSTEQTAEWHSGETSPKDLSVTIPTGDGGGVAPRYYIDTNLFGIETSFRISKTGEILKTIEATSEDGMLTLTIPDGTIALGEDGKRLKSLQAAIDESPPDPPEGSYIIELAYDFGPDGATFDPAITLEYTYDPAEIPEDVAEEDLVLAYYDEDADEWVELDCVVDTENNTITADVEHFTTFAIIGTVTPPEEEEVVPPEEEEEVVPPEEEEVVPPEEEEVVPPEEEIPTEPLVNWPVLGGIIGGVIVVGLLIFFLLRRRRAA